MGSYKKGDENVPLAVKPFILWTFPPIVDSGLNIMLQNTSTNCQDLSMLHKW